MAATPKPIRKMMKAHDNAVRGKTKDLIAHEGKHVKSMSKVIQKGVKLRRKKAKAHKATKSELHEAHKHMKEHGG